MKNMLIDFIYFLRPYTFNWDSEEHIEFLINKFIDQYQPERSKREDAITCSLPGITRNEIEEKLGCKIRTDFLCDGEAVL